MASNSKREQIILKLKEEIESIPSITTVERKRPTYESLLDDYAITQFPVVAMICGVPKPNAHYTGRVPKDCFVSEMNVSLYCYYQDNVNPDTTLSSLLDDLWSKIYTDPTKGQLVLDTTIKPEPSYDFWNPFYAFRMDVVMNYYHTIGGI